MTQDKPFNQAVSKVMNKLGRPEIQPGKTEFNDVLDRLLENAPKSFTRIGASRRDLLWIMPDPKRPKEAAISDWINRTRIAAWAGILGENNPESSLAETAANLMANTVPQMISPMPGAIEALQLAVGKTKLIAVTNGLATHQRRKLTLVGLLEPFDGIVTSADAGASKPSPEPFLMALELAGATPSDAVMIGDSLVNDVGGAQALGIPAIQVAGESPVGENSGQGEVVDSVLSAVRIALEL